MASDSFQRALDLIEVDWLFEALPLLNEVIAQQPERVEAYMQRARVRRRLKDPQGAIADYTQAVRLAPKAETYLARALVWLSLEQPKGAIADGREAIKLKPELAGGHRLLGKALGLLGDGVSATASYKQATRLYLDAKDKENAQACLDAIAPLQKLPPYKYATYAQPSGIALEPDKSASPEEFVRLVRLKYARGGYASALKDINWLLGCEPFHIEALCLRGLIQAQLGQRDLAIADLALAKQQGSDENEVRFCQGQMRLIFKDGYGAIEEFSALIEMAHDRPMAKYFLKRGDSYRQIEELESAFKDYSNAIALDTQNAELYELRGAMQQEMGEGEGAIADYQKAATLWLNEGDWQRHQSVIEKVRSLRKQGVTKSRSSRSATVTIKTYENHLPVVEVLFDGIAAFDMVIDRNATHSIVTKQMANRLNLELVSYRYVYLADGTPMELSIARLRSVVIGATVITDVYVAIAPDGSTPVLGKDCFSAYSVRISGNEITFVRR